jgi:hypothetical protein
VDTGASSQTISHGSRQHARLPATWKKVKEGIKRTRKEKVKGNALERDMAACSRYSPIAANCSA